PNWEVATFDLSQGGSSLLNVDFSGGPGGFVVGPDFSPAAGPWTYSGSAPVLFEINGDTLEADQMVTDKPGESSVIDLNGVEIIVGVIAGQADVGETFDLFDGGTLRGSYSGITLPEGQWDLSGLEEGGDGTITYVSTELGGWRVRALDVNGTGGFEQVNDLTEALLMIEETATAFNLDVQSDIETVYGVVDIGDNGGTFPDTQLYPDGVTGGHEDIILRAVAEVVIPPGKWTIAFGSDDGGRITIPGVDFSTGDGGFDGRFNEDFDPNGPFDPERGNDTVDYWKPRGHQWTGGTFSLTEPLETTITVTMYERGGGDSLEVAIVDVSDPDLFPFPPFSNADFNAAPGKALLGNGVLGWTVKSGALRGEPFRRSFVAGMGLSGDQEARVFREDEVFGPEVESPGLTQEWWQNANPGNKTAVDNVFSARSADNGPFKGTDGGGTGTWWTGNGASIDGVQDYPLASTLLRENYLTRLSGEIFIPESGLYRFKDGVDDFCFLGIDVDRDGAFAGEEVLISDNAWVGVEGVRGGVDNPSLGSPIGEVTMTVAAGGEWFPIEFNTGEGGGGDSGVLYWDYDPTGGGIGAGPEFPEFDDDPIDPFGTAADLLIPDTHLRSKIAPLLNAALVSSIEGVVEFDIAEDGSHDRLVLTNIDPGALTALFDL
ncbi:MAG: hypothetical protein P8J87_11590, partial [Verrucomicrobiales bacterium]|nr:hypothetical protein [Verrucomicrobiales bacterium]